MSKALPDESRLCAEMGEVLFNYYLLRRLVPDSADPLRNMKIMRFISLLINDIILRLCKFRDEDTRSLSFEQVQKSMRKRAAIAERVSGLDETIARYKRLTKNLEQHRDTYVAHLSKRGTAHLKPTTEIQDAIRLASEIVDTLTGVRNTYEVLGVDLRGELDGAA